MTDQTPSAEEFIWFRKSPEELLLLGGLCAEWQREEGFWNLEQVVKALSEFGVKGLCSRHGEHMNGFLLFQVIPGFSELLYLFIQKDFRRQGMAERFMSRYESYLRTIPDCASIFLEVRESNATAQALYEKLKFRRFGVRKGYYSNGENAINYRKDL